MKKLEDKILKKVFIYESKKTSTEVVWKIIFFIIVGFLIAIFASVLFETLDDEKMFDLFQIFREDFEVIRRYLFDVLYTFYQGAPKLILFFLAGFFVSFIIFIFFVIKNFAYLKNRILSVIKYWLRGGKVS